MPYPNPIYADGWFGPSTPRELSVIPTPKFPFANQPTPDIYSRTYDRLFQYTPRLFLPRISQRTAWTNLLTYSEDCTNAAWTKVNLTPTIVATPLAPDGNATINQLLETVTNAEHSAAQAGTTAAGATELFAFAAGALGRDWLRLNFTDSAAGVFSAFFNITNGYVGTVAGTGATALLVPLGNSQFQCILRFTPAAGAGTWKANVSTDGSTVSYTGDTTKGLYLWGAQLATGTSAPYIATTNATRAVSAPDRDTVDPMAYLVAEANPTLQNSQALTVARTFARVPLTQNDPTSLNVAKPALSGSFPQVFGSYRIFQPDITLAKYDAYAAQTVTSDTGIPAFYPTGGTYTLSFGGSTTGNLNYNDSAGTVQTALNALTPVTNRGGLTVSGSYNSPGGLVITWNSYAALTFNSAGLTYGGGAATVVPTVALTDAGFNQNLDTPGGVGITGATGGTFTITIFGQTTAGIAYNASLTDIQAALNALGNVSNRGNCVVSGLGAYDTGGGVYYYRFTVAFANAAFTGNAGNLLPGPCAIVCLVTGTGTGSTMKIGFSSATAIRTLYVAGHGVVAGNTLYLKSGATYYPGIAGNFTVPDANNIQITVAASAAYASAGTITELGKRTKQNYTPGTGSTAANNNTIFYLPGVTSGIATASDIPIPALQSDTTPLLLAIFAGSGNVNYQVGQITQHLGTILKQITTTVAAANL